VRFYQRREVKDIIAYLRLIQNPDSQMDLLRVINVPPRGLGQVSLQKLLRWGSSEGMSLPQAIRMVAWQISEGKGGELPVTRQAANSISNLVSLLKHLSEERDRLSAKALLDLLLDATGYHQYLLTEPQGEERWDNILELRGVTAQFDELEPGEGLAALLERLALMAAVDDYDQNDDVLTLITLHQAKGLEFPVVFIAGLEDGILPHMRSMDNEEEMEEERRLLYVGITRAKDKLYLLRAFRRNVAGGSGPTLPSRFLREIPSTLIAQPPKPVERSPWGEFVPGPSRRSREEVPFRAGDRVRHQTFGEGLVVNCRRADEDHEVTVVFRGTAGIKRLMLSLAPLEKLED
jgi:DNA helicase-2/ATP-dependent DNA helicase PcrA